jgi:hypothetical protein
VFEVRVGQVSPREVRAALEAYASSAAAHVKYITVCHVFNGTSSVIISHRALLLPTTNFLHIFPNTDRSCEVMQWQRSEEDAGQFYIKAALNIGVISISSTGTLHPVRRARGCLGPTRGGARRQC